MSTSSSSYSSSSSCDDVAKEARALKLFSTTPLIYSAPLSKLCQSHAVYLKLDCLQRSGSFKDRGMAHLCASVYKAHTDAAAAANRNDDVSSSSSRLKLISSSGGNAGLAITTVASLMPNKSIDVSVIVPQTTKPLVVTKLQSLGATVTVHGTNWNIADTLARQLVKESNGTAVYVSPYDNALLWTGHSTVVDEIIHQLLLEFNSSTSSSSLSPRHIKIGAILASVGGGGLLCGILEGIERNLGNSNDKSNIIRGCKVVACETEGAASFAASFNASSSSSATTATVAREGKKEVKMVQLSGITSIATSLGALEVTSEVIQRAHRHQERGKEDEGSSSEDVLSYVCTDSEAVDACIQFAADHRMLVEPACGAALAPLYSERLRVKLLDELRHDEDSVIVVEVCGGSGVNLELLEGWKTQFLS